MRWRAATSASGDGKQFEGGGRAVAEEFVSLILFDRWRSMPGVAVKVAGH